MIMTKPAESRIYALILHPKSLDGLINAVELGDYKRTHTKY